MKVNRAKHLNIDQHCCTITRRNKNNEFVAKEWVIFFLILKKTITKIYCWTKRISSKISELYNY